MESSTKERILDEALVSFAANGYKGTNLRDLAAGLSLSKSALYKHYPSKEAIWEALVNRMDRYYDERFAAPETTAAAPQSCEELVALTMRMLRFTMHDQRVILTRRFLLIEQFRDERARQLATAHFLTNTRDIFTGIFSRMMDAGLLRRDDPALLAFAYTAPITALVHLCDREPEKEPEILRQLEAFIAHFIETYRTDASRQAGNASEAVS